MPIRTAAVFCALSALALPALAGEPVTVTSAQRSIDVLLQGFGIDNGPVLTDEFVGSDSTDALSGPFSNSFSGSVTSSAVGSGFIESSLTTTRNGLVLENAANASANIGPLPDLVAADVSVLSETIIDFDLSTEARYTLAGRFSGRSGGANNRVALNGFSIALIQSPFNSLVFEPFDTSDLPAIPGGGGNDGFDTFRFVGDIAPGSYQLRIRTFVSADKDFFDSSALFDAAEIGHDLTFTVTPAPSALALLTIAPLAIRRRR